MYLRPGTCWKRLIASGQNYDFLLGYYEYTDVFVFWCASAKDIKTGRKTKTNTQWYYRVNLGWYLNNIWGRVSTLKQPVLLLNTNGILYFLAVVEYCYTNGFIVEPMLVKYDVPKNTWNTLTYLEHLEILIITHKFVFCI